MLKFCSLYSGSSGNCLFVKSDTTNILIDVGVSVKKIEQALSSLEVDTCTIDGILITHEHVDHAKSIGYISKKYNIPIYATKKTWDELKDQIQKMDIVNVKYFDKDSDFYIGDLKVHPFNTPHDAVDSCGFNIFHNDKKITIATDIGHINDYLFSKMENSNLLLIESNHDVEMLKHGRYPYFLKQRVISDVGHLSNEHCSDTICSLVQKGLNKVILGHLSHENNFPELAYETLISKFKQNEISFDNLYIKIAQRDSVGDFIEV